MPDAVPAAPAASPTTPAPNGMEAAVQLLQGLGTAKPATPPPPAPAAAPAPVQAAPPTAKPPDLDPVARVQANQVRRERELLDGQRALKAAREELSVQRKQIEAQLAEIRQQLKTAQDAEAQRTARRAEYLRDPRLVLQDTGVDFQALAQAIMNDGQVSPEQLLKATEARIQQATGAQAKEIEALKAQLADREKTAEQRAQEAQKAEREQAIAYLKADIKSTLDANPDEFELTRFFKRENLVLEAMESHYQETGLELSPMDAAKKVEKYLRDEVDQLEKTKTYGERFKKPAAPAAAPAVVPAPPPSPTLGNLPPPPTAPSRVSGEPDWKGALAALQGAKF